MQAPPIVGKAPGATGAAAAAKPNDWSFAPSNILPTGPGGAPLTPEQFEAQKHA